MRPRMFVELCAASAAVSLALLGGPGTRPPVAWQGAKTGFAGAVLGEVGLRPSDGADALWLNEPGPWGAAWERLVRPAEARVVAERLRAWASRDQRILWSTVTAGRAWATGEDPAAWLLGVHHTFGNAPPEPDGTPGAEFADIEPRDGSPGRPPARLAPVADRVEALARLWPADVRVTRASALSLSPPSGVDARWVVYLDPPYAGTRGYGPRDLDRAGVLVVARRWARAGATVIVSEDEPLLALGSAWRYRRVTASRVGAARNRSRQKEEWVSVYLPGGVL